MITRICSAQLVAQQVTLSMFPRVFLLNFQGGTFIRIYLVGISCVCILIFQDYMLHTGVFFSILSNMTCARVCIPHSSSDVSGKIHRLLVKNEMLYSDCRFSLVDRHHFLNYNASQYFVFWYIKFVEVYWFHEIYFGILNWIMIESLKSQVFITMTFQQSIAQCNIAFLQSGLINVLLITNEDDSETFFSRF